MKYTRKMLDHDYSEEACNYKEADMTREQIEADVKKCLAEYELEDEEIISNYIENIMAAM